VQRVSSPNAPIAGRVVLVTGAAKGIGAATTRELIRRGASVGLVDIDANAVNALARDLGAAAAAWVADIRDAEQIERAVDGVVTRFGGLDAVVANAGVEILGELGELAPTDFARVIEVNLIGTWRTIRATLPAVARRRGYYLLVSSLSAVAHAPYNGAYDASKAGVVSLAKTLRLETRARGIGVGIAYLSYVDTPAAREAVETPRMQALLARMPGGAPRPMPVEDVARAFATAIDRRSARVVLPRSQIAGVYLPELAQAVIDRVLRNADPEETPRG